MYAHFFFSESMKVYTYKVLKYTTAFKKPTESTTNLFLFNTPQANCVIFYSPPSTPYVDIFFAKNQVTSRF